MNKKIQILLGNQKNIRSVNVDNYDKIELFNSVVDIMDYDVNEAVNSTEVFDAEREVYQIYGIYGRIEYMSLLNNINSKYTVFQDFLTPKFTGSTKNIFNSFDFYLVRPSTGYTQLTGVTGSGATYVRYFEVIATPDDFELFNAGFSNNLYGEQTYAFNFRKDFDISNYFDNFNFPATELFLYVKYKPTQNGYGTPEHIYYSKWDDTGYPVKTLLSTATLNIGDKIYGDMINYVKEEFIQTQVQETFTQTNILGQVYFITTACTHPTLVDITLRWKYNPFISLRLAYLSNELYTANTGTTSYDIKESIPAYATPIDNVGNLVWRDILPQGYVDPLTGLGVDYPFINWRRYLFSRIILSIVPDVTEDYYTMIAFNSINYSPKSSILNVLPNSDLSNIGKPCQ